MDWSSFLAYPVDQLPFIFVVLLLSFTVHEFAHAFFADRFGDPTPRSLGRLTLNPRVHMDWLGMIFFLIIGIGWAKPVLVNRSRFKNPRIMGIIVSAAGPISNLILGFISLLVFFLLFKFNVLEHASQGVTEAVRLFFSFMIMTNIFLFILNLLPLPPLDGYRIIEDLLPTSVMMKIKAYEQWMFYAMLLMFFIPPIRRVTIAPIFALQWDIFNAFHKIAVWIFGSGVVKM